MYIILMLWRAMWALCEHWGKQVVVIDVILEVAFAGVVGDAGRWSRRARDGGADDVGWRRLSSRNDRIADDYGDIAAVDDDVA